MGVHHTRPLGPSGSEGRVQDPFSQGSALVTHSHQSHVGSSTSIRGCSNSDRQRSGGKGPQSLFSGILQSPISCSQERWPLATDHRSVCSERLHRRSDLQDGISCFHQEIHPTRPLGSFSGFDRRLFSCRNPSLFSEIPSVLLRPRGFPISGTPIWPVHCATGLHQADASGWSPSAPWRFSSTPVLRRLAPSPARSSSTHFGPHSQLARPSGPWPPSQCGQVRLDSLPEFCLRGNEFSDGPRQSQGPPGPSRLFGFSGSDLPVPTTSIGQVLPVSSGRSQRCSRSGHSGSPSPQAPPVSPPVPLETSPRFFGRFHSSSFGSRSPPILVAEQSSLGLGSPTFDPFPPPSSDHRFQSRRLGRPSRTSRPDDFRHLVRIRVESPHQQPGDEGGPASSQFLPVSPARTSCPTSLRQHHSDLSCSETGRDSLLVSVSGSAVTSSVVSVTSDVSQCQTHSRSSQCPCRQSFPSISGSADRMVSSSGSSQLCLSGTRDPYGRSVCHQVQSPSTSVCVPSSRPSCMGSRCSIPELELSGGLRVPPVRANSSSVEQDQDLLLQNHPHSPLVAPEVLVLGSPKSPQGLPKSPAPEAGPPVSEGQPPPSRSCPSAPSRLAVIRGALRKRKFSSRATSLITAARRESTSAVYNAKWKVYVDWCSEEQVDPLRPSMRRLADFFIFLFDVKKLAVSTIKGYRSMISHTLSFRGSVSIGSDPNLSELFRAFELKRPVTRSLTPKWDLSCVLLSLTKAPFEPLDLAPIKYLSWKTAFLLTLASAKRRSEIHALSVEEGHLRFNTSDGSVSLLCQPGFLAKTQLPSVAPTPFSIPSLSRSCGRDDADRLLCPVRALKFYLARTKSLRGNRKRLFIPQKGGGDISASSISRWVACTIKHAYSSLSELDLSHFQVRAHEVRALSTSWAFVNHVPLDDILKATYWRNSSTFSSFYLRSFSSQRDNLFLLGPFVASEAVVSVPSASDQ